MSFRFNWSRLDETAAEAIRFLLNKKLQDLVNAKFSGNDDMDSPASNTAAAAAGATASATGTGAGGLGGGGNNTENVSVLGGRETGSSSGPGSCLGGPGSSTPATGKPPTSFGSVGAGGAMPGGGGANTGSSTVNHNVGAGGAANVPGPPGSAGSLPLAAGGGPSPGSSPAAMGSGLSMGPTSATTVSTVGGGPTAGAVGAAPAAASSATPGSSSAPPAATKRNKVILEHLTVTSLEWGTAPPFMELVNFSDALSFVEPQAESARNSLGLQDPTQLSSTTSPHYHHQHHPHSPHSSHYHSTSSLRGGASGATGGGGPTSLYSRHSPQAFTPTASYMNAAAGSNGGVGSNANGVDATSDASTGRGNRSSHNNANTSASSIFPSGGGSGGPPARQAGCLTLASPPYGGPLHSHQHSPASCQGYGGGEEWERSAPAAPASADVVDTLAPYLGPGGLFVRFHLTYGGSLRVSLASAVRYNLAILDPSITLPLRMPLALSLSDMDLDCYVCCNLHRNTCRIWLEPGKLSASPINRVSATGVFGERPGSMYDGGIGEPGGGSSNNSNNGGSGNNAVGGNVGGGSAGGNPASVANAVDADLDCDSSLEYFSRYGSSFSEDGDNDYVLVDDRQVEQFVLRELKALLKNKIMAPHYVSVPVVLGQ